MNHARRWILVVAVHVASAMTQANAEVVQFSDQFGPQSYTFSVYDEGTTIESDQRTASLTFPKFDSAIGTLESVRIEFTSVADATVTAFQSNASSTNAVNANMRVEYTLTAPGISASNDSVFFNRTVSNSNPVFQIDYGQRSHGVVSDTTATSLAAYIGSGTINAQLRMEFLQNAFSSSSSLDYQFSTNTATTATITYTATAIPEPSAAGVLLLVSFGLCLRRNQRR